MLTLKGFPWPRTYCGPLQAALRGCLEYWLCCVGFKRLYLGRAGGKTVEDMKKDMDKQLLDPVLVHVSYMVLFRSRLGILGVAGCGTRCGYDQQGFYCHWFEKRAVAEDSVDSDEETGILR